MDDDRHLWSDNYPYISERHAPRAIVDWALAAAIVGVLAFSLWGAERVAGWLA